MQLFIWNCLPPFLHWNCVENLLLDDIKEEEMEIEALEYDDDFANDPSFSILDDKGLAEDELNDIFGNSDADGDADADADSNGSSSDLDESENTPRKKRRKVQVPDNKIYK